MKIVMFFFIFFYVGCVNKAILEEKKVKRIALVIGNQNYEDNELKNSLNDAKGVAETLRRIGFEVLPRYNVTLAELEESLALLKAKIEPNNTMVFIYFAGHGNTLRKNSAEEFLLMTDKEQQKLVSIYKFYDLLREAKARYNIICIDACRDYKEYKADEREKVSNFRGNFLTRTMRHGKGRKAIENAFLDNKYSYKLPRSTIVSYAAMHHQRASDGTEYDLPNSPYASALMKYLDDKEIPIEEVFRRVRVSLLKQTNGIQSNLEETNLEKNIWLLPKKTGISFMPPI